MTLFSAAPRAVPLSVLSRETLADPLLLRRSLDHLDNIGAITTEAGSKAEPVLGLTSSGLRFAVLVTYRVINASISRQSEGLLLELRFQDSDDAKYVPYSNVNYTPFISGFGDKRRSDSYRS